MYCTEQHPTSATALQPYTHDAAVQIEIFDSHSECRRLQEEA